MALHNLGFGPGNPGLNPANTLSGVPVVPGKLIAAKPAVPGQETSIRGKLPTQEDDPGFLQRLLGLKADSSSLDRLLAIIGSVFPTSAAGIASGGGGANGGIGGLVGSILGLGKDKK